MATTFRVTKLQVTKLQAAVSARHGEAGAVDVLITDSDPDLYPAPHPGLASDVEGTSPRVVRA